MDAKEERPSGYIVYIEGAPKAILPCCWRILEDGRNVPLTPARRQRLGNVNRDVAQGALQVLAVAVRMIEQGDRVLASKARGYRSGGFKCLERRR